jgi:hypothetical protein
VDRRSGETPNRVGANHTHHDQQPWIATSGKNVFRVNVGVVNPNPVSATFRIKGESFGNGAGNNPYWTPWAQPSGFDVVLPPWGWLQINDVFALLQAILQPGWGTPIEAWLAPASVIIEPLGDLPAAQRPGVHRSGPVHAVKCRQAGEHGVCSDRREGDACARPLQRRRPTVAVRSEARG